MLGKLIKHEFKSTAHSMFGIYLSALFTFLAMLLVFFIKNRTLMITGSLVLVGICVAAIVVTLFAIIGTFNKSLYGNQGYLSFTLPVSGKSLLASKTVVSLAWIFISFAFIIAVAAFLLFYWIAQTSESFKDIVNMVYTTLQTMMGMPDAETAVKSIAVLVALLFMKALFLIFKVSFSLTIANTKSFQKLNPVLAAILVYFAIYLVLNAANLAAAFIPVQLAIATNGIGLTVGETMIGLAENANVFLPLPILGYIFEAVVCVALYLLTGDIMTKRVNVK
ncbi:MAG: hypothetical protein FWF05_01435 [Oscillospiraceae bacterium]|nr:hypothetical protein [Oscillospiraceae bacterium]